MKRLRVLIVAPPVLPVSPKIKYAGTERIVYYLSKELDSYVDCCSERTSEPWKLLFIMFK
jgi:hypothetical protein